MCSSHRMGEGKDAMSLQHIKDITSTHHGPAKLAGVCSCRSSGWAEIKIRRPTGNVGWMMHLQNRPHPLSLTHPSVHSIPCSEVGLVSASLPSEKLTTGAETSAGGKEKVFFSREVGSFTEISVLPSREEHVTRKDGEESLAVSEKQQQTAKELVYDEGGQGGEGVWELAKDKEVSKENDGGNLGEQEVIKQRRKSLGEQEVTNHRRKSLGKNEVINHRRKSLGEQEVVNHRRKSLVEQEVINRTRKSLGEQEVINQRRKSREEVGGVCGSEAKAKVVETGGKDEAGRQDAAGLLTIEEAAAVAELRKDSISTDDSRQFSSMTSLSPDYMVSPTQSKRSAHSQSWSEKQGSSPLLISSAPRASSYSFSVEHLPPLFSYDEGEEFGRSLALHQGAAVTSVEEQVRVILPCLEFNAS